jgi:holo-[acyl-carrier protein] synthase
MIVGVGSDIVALVRIRKMLASRKQQFLDRILTNNEKLDIQHNRIDGYVANRFAAKEAFSKALGTGIGQYVSFQDLEVVKTPEGRPFFNLSTTLQEFIRDRFGEDVAVHLSMSNEAEYAHATVIIEVL